MMTREVGKNVDEYGILHMEFSSREESINVLNALDQENHEVYVGYRRDILNLKS
jgi:hypothetical protein